MKVQEMKFKKELIFDHKEKTEIEIEQLTAKARVVSDTFNKVGLTLKRELTREDETAIVDEGFNYVLRQLRAQFPHENATDELNLQLMGLELENLPNEVNTIKNYFDNGIELNSKGGVVVSSEKKKAIIEKNKLYTTSEKQNHALKVANELCEFINSKIDDILSLQSHKFSKSSTLDVIAESMECVITEKVDGEFVLVPDALTISRL